MDATSGASMYTPGLSRINVAQSLVF